MICVETLASLQTADPELLNRIITVEAYPNDAANMKSIRDILANVSDPYEEWCKEFDDYFLNRLGDCPYDL